MESTRPLHPILAVFVVGLEYFLFVGSANTMAVTWTWYYSVAEMSWNDASRFCNVRGGHLPVTNSNVSMASLQDAVDTWSADGKLPALGDFWIGLYSPEVGVTANVWEVDCAEILPNSVYHWDTDFTEPNDQDSAFCIRLGLSSKLWRTIGCGSSYGVVCEKRAGNCTYKSLADVTMTQQPNASKAGVVDVSECWALCLELRQDGQECVAAAYSGGKTQVCGLHLGDALLLGAAALTGTRDSKGDTLMLKRCFTYATDPKEYAGFSQTNWDNDPLPATGVCPVDTLRAAKAELDFIPPGVVRGLVPEATTVPTTAQATTTGVEDSTTPATETTPVPTTAQATTTGVENSTTPATESTAASTVTTSPQVTTATTVRAGQDIRLTAATATTTTAATTTTIKITAITRQLNNIIPNGITTTAAANAANATTATTTNAVTNSASTPDLNDTVTTAETNPTPTSPEEHPTDDLSVATLPTTDHNTMVTTAGTNPPSTTAEEHPTDALGVVTPPTPPDSSPPPPAPTTNNTSPPPPNPQCPCDCLVLAANSSTAGPHSMFNNGSVTTSDDEDLLVQKNLTSKYRRAHTSAMVTHTSYSVIGTSWLLVCLCPLLLLVLVDLGRVAAWLGKRSKSFCAA